MAASADRHLLFGLIAVSGLGADQPGPTRCRVSGVGHARQARSLADLLTEQGGLESDGRAAVEAMVGVHLKKHSEDTEKSLAAIPAGRSTCERLAAVGDPDLSGTVVHVASRPSDSDTDLTPTYSVGRSTSDGQRFRVLRPMREADWGRCSWRSIAS